MAEGRSSTTLLRLRQRGFNLSSCADDPDDEDGEDSSWFFWSPPAQSGQRPLHTSDYLTVRLKFPKPAFLKKYLRKYMRHLIRSLRNRLWPETPATLLGITVVVTAMTVSAEGDSWLRSGWLADLLWRIDSWVLSSRLVNPLRLPGPPIPVRVAYLAMSASFVGTLMLVALKRAVLKALLTWHGFLFLVRPASDASQAWRLRVWAWLVTTLSGSRSMTYGFQRSLPSLPLPSLRATCERFLESIEPVADKHVVERAKALSEEFLKVEGPNLQLILLARRLALTNYVNPWWERFAYLSMRHSLCLNSNYYVMDACHPPSGPCKDQVFRAANLVHQMVRFQEAIDSERVEPLLLRGIVPMCMAQYEKLFGTTRVPGIVEDRLRHTQESGHIIVTRRGKFFLLKTRRRHTGHILTCAEFAHQLRAIVEQADEDEILEGVVAGEVGYLTSMRRDVWARVCLDHFSDGPNRKALEAIETAAFVVHLDHSSVTASGSPKRSVAQLRRARALFHGSETTPIWFDKSINLVVFPDGHAGLNAELSWGEAPVVAHMWEWCLLNELLDVQAQRDASSSAGDSLRGEPLPLSRALEFHFTPELNELIESAKRDHRRAVDEVDLEILAFDEFGTDALKAAGISPDALIQCALHLAYYRESPSKRLSLTYESCTTKLFRDGRTETIRTATKEVEELVRAVDAWVAEDAPRDKARVADLFRRACSKHHYQARLAMSGQGVDRHLFALYVAARGSQTKSPFLDLCMDSSLLPWKLSTSHQPQNQVKGLREELQPTVEKRFYSPGGGFSPIDDAGYGIAYTFAGSEKIFFHVSAKRGASNPAAATDAKRFAQGIRQALTDLGGLVL